MKRLGLALLLLLAMAAGLPAQSLKVLLKDLEKATTAHAKIEATVKIAEYHSNRKDAGRALEYLARAMKINDREAIYHYEDDIFFSVLIKTISHVSVDSLKLAFNALPKDAQTPSFYNLFGYQAIYDHDPSYAITIAQQALDLSTSSNNTLQAAESHYNIGQMMFYFGTSNDDELHFTAALKLFQAIPDTLGMSKSKHYLGQLYQWDFQMEEALALFDEALELACAIEDRKQQFLILESIHEVKLWMGKYGEVQRIQTELYCLAHELEREDPDWLVLAGNIEAGFLTRTGNYKDAMPMVRATIQNYEANELKFSYLPASYNVLAECYFKTGVYDTAMIYYQLSVDYAKKYYNDFMLRGSLMSLALLQFEIGDKETGMEYSGQVNQQFADTSYADLIEFKDHQRQWNIVFFEKTGELDSALYYAKEALAMDREKGLNGFVTNSILKVGTLYMQLGQPDLAETFFQEALGNAKKIGQEGLAATSLLHWAEADIAQQDFKSALAHARSSLEIAEQHQIKHLLPDIYKSLSIASAKTGDFQMAYQYQYQYDQLQDSLLGFVQKQQIAKYESLYRLKEKGLDNERLHVENERQHLTIRKMTSQAVALVVVIFLTLIAAYLFKERAKLLAEKKLRKQITRDIHDDVGTTLNNLKMTIKEAIEEQTNGGAAQTKLAKAVLLGNQAMDSLKNLIWKVDGQEIAQKDLADAINAVTQELLASHQIPYQLDLSGFENQETLSSKTYHHLMMIYKEALNNTIRHGDQKKVNIDFGHKDGTMSIRLKNGIPEIPTTASGSNKGLLNMKERIALLGGEVVFSEADGQFEVQITLTHV